MDVLIYGLGTLGGGFSAASYFLNKGHQVTVTDLRGEKELGDPLRLLKERGAKAVCGKHDQQDFIKADLVVKNPAVPIDSPYLSLAKKVTTDITYLMQSPLTKEIKTVAVTGTKGKTTTVATAAHILNKANHETLQFGNMGISGFAILEELEQRYVNKQAMPEYLICELSSWQIRDLYYTLEEDQLLSFKIVLLTSLFADHLNTYADFNSYKEDKWLLLRGKKGRLIISEDDLGEFENLKNVRTIESFSGALEQTMRNRPAWAICKSLGLGNKQILSALNTFRGVPHRQEQLGIHNNIVFINDSSATIPEAVNFTLLSIPWPFHLICGGADKNLKVDAMIKPLKNALHVHLLDGTFTQNKLLPLLKKENIPYSGPFDSMDDAFASAYQKATECLDVHKTVAVVLSPGAASFGIFNHEFDRGEQFRELYNKLN